MQWPESQRTTHPRRPLGWGHLAVYGVTCCRRCGTTDQPHEGRGLCLGCYALLYKGGKAPPDPALYPCLDPRSRRGARPPTPPAQADLRLTSAALRAIGGPQARLAYRLLRAAPSLWGLSLEALIGSSREARLVEARRVLVELLVSYAGLSASQAARVMQRDHSTALYHRARIARRLEQGDPHLAMLLEDAVRALVPADDGVYQPDDPRTQTQALATRRRAQLARAV